MTRRGQSRSKALFFEDEDAQKRIMLAGHPKTQKAIGRKVKGFIKDKWDKYARDFVYRGNYEKFRQHSDLWEKLKATAGTTLVEASPSDHIWGIGLSEHDPRALDRSKWQGTNWLGEVLTCVRDDILAGCYRWEKFPWTVPEDPLPVAQRNEEITLEDVEKLVGICKEIQKQGSEPETCRRIPKKDRSPN